MKFLVVVYPVVLVIYFLSLFFDFLVIKGKDVFSFFFGFSLKPQDVKIWITASIPGVFCLIGTSLTFRLRRRLLFISELHESAGQHINPMELHWPSGLENEDKATIRKGTKEGIGLFRKLFVEPGKPVEEEKSQKVKSQKDQILTYNMPKSRVHAESDLWVQSYILSLPSVQKKEGIDEEEKKKIKKEEIKEIKYKVFMVLVSHWLDDMLDGRYEAEIFRKISKFEGGVNKVLSVEESEDIFEEIFKDVVDKYIKGIVIDKPIGKKGFSKRLLTKIEESAGPDHRPQKEGGKTITRKNQEYIFLGLNRVALGSIISGPRISEKDRKKVIKGHNEKLLELVQESKISDKNKKWKESVESYIKKMLKDKEDIGQTLLALTTKTTQEIAMGSEGDELNFPLSLLFSILYAPLLYFHDYKEETEFGEIVPLDAFLDYELIKECLAKAKELCEDAKTFNSRWDLQKQQLEMAFKCFEKRLPELSQEVLKSIYVPTPR
jgi:hypothetical protein